MLYPPGKPSGSGMLPQPLGPVWWVVTSGAVGKVLNVGATVKTRAGVRAEIREKDHEPVEGDEYVQYEQSGPTADWVGREGDQHHTVINYVG